MADPITSAVSGASGAAATAATGAALGSVVPGLGTAIGGIVGAVGGLLGNLFASGDQASATQALQNAYNTIQAVGAPPDLAKQIIYQQFQQAGLYSPQFQQAVEQTTSATANVQQDQQAANAQSQALQQLQQVSKLGLTSQDLANMQQARTQINSDASARAGTITQGMQARGMAGSGSELAAQLSNSQNADNQESQNALGIAGQANQRALQAISGAGNLAGNINQQEIGLNTTRAQAQDAMNRFNIQNQMSVNAANVGAANQAQQQNLATKQNVTNANTAQANAESLRQNQQAQQDYYNQLNYAQAMAGADKNLANLYGANAQNTRSTVGGISAGLGQGTSSIYNYLNGSSNTNNSNNGNNNNNNVPLNSQSNEEANGITGGNSVPDLNTNFGSYS